MKMGVNTYMWTNRFSAGDLGLIEHIHGLGADGIEFARSGFDGLPTDDIRAELHRLGMGCTLCTSPPDPESSIIHPLAKARANGVRYLREAIAVAARIGAETVAGLLYTKVGWFTGERRTSQEWDWAVAAFRELAPDLERCNLTLAIEPVNRWETFFINTAAEGVALCEAIGNPRIGLLLDSVHMGIEEKSQAMAVRSAVRWLRHVHVAENDRGTPGTGQTDWAALLGALRDVAFDRWCMIESFAWNKPDIAAATHCWRDLAESPDALAREGLTFLRAIHAASSNPTSGTPTSSRPGDRVSTIIESGMAGSGP
jgi:D-psicose/D-tagatose/L-ribulose 3-epimerase